MKKIWLLSSLLSFSIMANSQTIFTYGKNEVSKQEFLKMFQKNNIKNDYSRANIQEYIDLYSLFKMKIAEAEHLKIDTLDQVKNELNNYQNQLASSYLIDKNAKENLLQEAYQRSKEEIKVAHILISSRSAIDTLSAYRKIMDIQSQLKSNPEKFEQLAKEKSEDRGTGKNGGMLGYISALNVVYPFETMAYNTPVGSYSEPFRTQYGYHILKVYDRRPSKGTVQVQHILLTPLNRNDETEVNKTLIEAGKIAQLVKIGADFDSMAKAISQDKFSKNEGGRLAPFRSGQMVSAFEEAAFSLNKPGDVTGPIKTDYGYHIIRLIKKDNNPSLTEMREEMSKKIDKDGRLEIAQKAIVAEQLKKMDYFENKDALMPFINRVKGDTAFSLPLTIGDFANMNSPMFGVKGVKYTQQDFAKFLLDATNGKIYGNKEQSINDIYSMYKDNKIKEMQVKNLEQTNAEFKSTLQEYREGILLFEMMDKNVWSKGINDKEGLEAFYNENKNRYQYDEAFDGYLFQTDNKDLLNQLKAKIEANEDIAHSISEINSYNEAGSQLKYEEGIFEFAKHGLEASKQDVNKMSTIIAKPNGVYVAYYPKSFIAKGSIKPLESTKGAVVSDYQTYLEQNWNKYLKEKYPLKVNQKIVDTIVK